MISTTDNFLCAIYYAFRATLATPYDPSQEGNLVLPLFVLAILIVEQVYIYLISNDIRYRGRGSETQLRLNAPAIRAEYLKE